MFFVLSKILVFLLMPLTWIIAVLVFALLSKEETKRKKLFWLSIGMIYVFSNSFIADEFMRAWEIKYDKTDYAPEQEQSFDYAIVMGGMTWYNEKLQKPQFLRSSDRLFQTLWLLKQQKIKKIIFTGGSGSIEHADHKEGEIIRRWLNQIGIPDSVLIIENESKNTHENAVYTKKILEDLKYQDKKVLLVTSAFHMRRSLACFKKEGVTNLFPYITDSYSGQRKFQFDHCFIPSSDALQVYNLLFHEVFGFITYKVMGYC